MLIFCLLEKYDSTNMFLFESFIFLFVNNTTGVLVKVEKKILLKSRCYHSSTIYAYINIFSDENYIKWIKLIVCIILKRFLNSTKKETKKSFSNSNNNFKMIFRLLLCNNFKRISIEQFSELYQSRKKMFVEKNEKRNSKTPKMHLCRKKRFCVCIYAHIAGLPLI